MPLRFDEAERLEILKHSIQCLWSEDGKVALDYLINKRHLSENVLKLYQIGFLPEKLSKMKFPVYRYGFKQLAGRIIFPIFDSSNNLISLSSRLITSPTNDLPIYWHEKYEKSFYLYGLNLAKYYMYKWKFACLVEGQIDVMQMNNYGIYNTSGITSLNFSLMQLSTLLRYCTEIILILDNDAKRQGQNAAEKIIKEYSIGHDQEYAIKIGTVNLEENIDPDEYLVKYGRDNLMSKIKTEVLRLRNKNVT